LHDGVLDLDGLHGFVEFGKGITPTKQVNHSTLKDCCG
jgi:hypothetical protein